MSSTIDFKLAGVQRLDCGCIVEIRYGTPLWNETCPVVAGLFTSMVGAPERNARLCAERDALRAHIGYVQGV
jgi:hypothetical protein